WHVPMAHEYEGWSDARAFDGTATIQQPQTRPLYGGRSAHEVLAVLQGDTMADDYALLRTHWQRAPAERGGDFERFWHEALRVGVVENSAATPVSVSPKAELAASLPPPKRGAGINLLFRADEALGDGRH